MTAGSLTLAYLLLAVNATGPDGTEYMNSPKFSIPITVQPERRAEISALELHMSSDQGKSWQFLQRATPDKKEFQVDTRGEGGFWFSVVVVDAQSKRDPVDIRSAQVGQRVIVDSIPPVITLTAERQNEEVVVKWDVFEVNLDPRSLKIEWAQGASQPVVAPMLNEPRGMTRFRPTDPNAAVSIRMIASDMSGNQGSGATEVPALATAPPGHTVSSYNTVQQPPTGRQPSSPSDPTPPPMNLTPLVPPNSPLTPGSARTVAQVGPTGASPLQPETVTTAYNPQLPQVLIVNKRQVKLEFDVAKYGPTGLAVNGDVYVTMDDGRTWEKSPLDPGAWSMPASVNGVGPLHGSVTVQLNKEAAVYGFYLIVKSRAGLGKAPPKSGDVPQIRVEVDTTAPSAQLFEPQADPMQPNTLTVVWTATDAHLAQNPITLEWAAKKEGPWQFIGEATQPNSGRYNWHITNDIPPSVFLRLTVRDSAGNTAIAETDKPVLVDLSMPEVIGVGLQINNNPR